MASKSQLRDAITKHARNGRIGGLTNLIVHRAETAFQHALQAGPEQCQYDIVEVFPLLQDPEEREFFLRALKNACDIVCQENNPLLWRQSLFYLIEQSIFSQHELAVLLHFLPKHSESYMPLLTKASTSTNKSLLRLCVPLVSKVAKSLSENYEESGFEALKNILDHLVKSHDWSHYSLPMALTALGERAGPIWVDWLLTGSDPLGRQSALALAELGPKAKQALPAIYAKLAPALNPAPKPFTIQVEPKSDYWATLFIAAIWIEPSKAQRIDLIARGLLSADPQIVLAAADIAKLFQVLRDQIPFTRTTILRARWVPPFTLLFAT